MKSILQIIEPEYLKRIHNGYYHTPTVYFHSNSAVRKLFWKRFSSIAKIIQNSDIQYDTCLDFGGGSGVFLPTLSKLFKKVILIDLEPTQAILIKKKFKLDNCEIMKKNIFDCTFEKIDCIIAADVLEHFKNTDEIIVRLKKIMRKNTTLITSLPTENWLYILLRILFRQEKPIDHYYSSKEIKTRLKENGLIMNKKINIPLPQPFSLFNINSWKLNA